MKNVSSFNDGPVTKNRTALLIKKIIITAAACIFALFFLLPTVLTITNSFMSATEIKANYGKVFQSAESGTKSYVGERVKLKIIPDMVTVEQYKTVLFKSPDYLFKFWNSLIYAAPIAILQIFFAMGASYAFARFEGKCKSMKRIPKAIFEAARVDGANEFTIFFKICAPLVKGQAFSIGILIFIDYWNMVEQPLILLKDDKLQPLSIFLSRINSGEIGLAFAVAVIYMIPCLLTFLYGEDYLVEGITTQGGVKG